MDGFIWEQAPSREKKDASQPVRAEEDVAKFLVDEHLSDLDRALLFLTGGHPVQSRHAIDSLPTIVRSRGRPGLEVLLAPLKNVMFTLDSDGQIAIAESFATIAKERIISSADFSELLLPLILRNVSSHKQVDEENDAWQNCLSEAIPLLDRGTIRNDILSLALSKGQVDELVTARIISCKLLGAIAGPLGADDVQKYCWERARALCQDTDYQVRVVMCKELTSLAQVLKGDILNGPLLNELLELMKDEEVDVRIAALTTLSNIATLMSREQRQTKIKAVWRKHMQLLSFEAPVQAAIARLFATILAVAIQDFNGDDAALYFAAFRHLSVCQDIELRRVAASQFATVVKLGGKAVYINQLHDALSSLACDTEQDVRKHIASSFHEICRVLGEDSTAEWLQRPFLSLLDDESTEVKTVLHANLHSCLNAFCFKVEIQQEQFISAVCQALIKAEQSLQNKWRSQLVYINAFTHFVPIFSNEQLYDQFLPVALRCLTNTAVAVTSAAADAAVCIFRSLRKDRQRTEIYFKMIREYARGKSYWNRLAFILLCNHVLRRFSTRFFKEYLLDCCCELLNDPVPNVRMHVSKLLPFLKQTIRLPEDVEQLERLNSAMSNLMTDNDRDVSQIARTVHETYKRTPIRMAMGAGVLDMNGAAGGQADFESDDRRKEEEEIDFTFVPEELEKFRAEEYIVRTKKKEHRYSDGMSASPYRSAKPGGRSPGPGAQKPEPPGKLSGGAGQFSQNAAAIRNSGSLSSADLKNNGLRASAPSLLEAFKNSAGGKGSVGNMTAAALKTVTGSPRPSQFSPASQRTNLPPSPTSTLSSGGVKLPYLSPPKPAPGSPTTTSGARTIASSASFTKQRSPSPSPAAQVPRRTADRR